MDIHKHKHTHTLSPTPTHIQHCQSREKRTARKGMIDGRRGRRVRDEDKGKVNRREKKG